MRVETPVMSAFFINTRRRGQRKVEEKLGNLETQKLIHLRAARLRRQGKATSRGLLVKRMKILVSRDCIENFLGY